MVPGLRSFKRVRLAPRRAILHFMRLLFLASTCLLALSAPAASAWLTDLDVAKAQALKENKPILVDFTGSDWCAPCQALRKNVFESPEFAAVASQYVLVELDYPHRKPQSPSLVAKHAEVAKCFGVDGFPTVLLIDAKSGEVFGRTVGFSGPVQVFLEKLASFKNTPEGRAALVEDKKQADALSLQKKARLQLVEDAHVAKMDAAIRGRDFKAAELELEAYISHPAARPILLLHKADVLLKIDPRARAQVNQYLDEALKLAAVNDNLKDGIKVEAEKIRQRLPR